MFVSATFLKKGDVKNFPAGDFLVYIVCSTFNNGNECSRMKFDITYCKKRSAIAICNRRALL